MQISMPEARICFKDKTKCSEAIFNPVHTTYPLQKDCMMRQASSSLHINDKGSGGRGL